MPSDKNAYNKNIIDTHAIIDAFGGIRPMAQKLNIAASTIQGWKARNNIPMARLDEIIKIAARDNINISLNNNDEDIIKLSDVIDGEVEVTKKTVSVEKPIILDDKSDNSKATATKESLYDSNISKSIATKETVSKSNNNHSNKLSWLAIILFVILAAAMVMHSIWSPITDKLITKYTNINIKNNNSIESKNNVISDEKYQKIITDISIFKDKIEKLSQRLEVIAKQQKIIAPAAKLDMTPIMTQLDEIIASKFNDKLNSEINNQVNQQINAEIKKLAINNIKSSLSDVTAYNIDFNDKLSLLNQKITNLDKKSNQFDIKLKLNTEIQSELRSKMQSKSGEVTFAPLLIAISQLEEEILSGKAYEGDINNIRTIIKPHQGLIPNINMAVDMLDKNAKNGIATKLELIRQFARLAPDAQTAYKKANAKNWIDQTFENVKGLISIRKIGNSPDLSPISLAEYALAQDDLAAAISALEILNDVKMVGEWLTVAKQRVLAINNLSILRKESIALLTKNKLEITQ